MTIIQIAAWKNTPEVKEKTMGNNYPKQIRDLIAERAEQGDAGKRREHLLIRQTKRPQSTN
jgi:hypothetical protein